MNAIRIAAQNFDSVYTNYDKDQGIIRLAIHCANGSLATKLSYMQTQDLIEALKQSLEAVLIHAKTQ